MKPQSKQYPIGHLMNPKTPYVNSANTNIRATFERIRATLKTPEKRLTLALLQRSK